MAIETKFIFKAKLEYGYDTPVKFKTNDMERDIEKFIHWLNLHLDNKKIKLESKE